MSKTDIDKWKTAQQKELFYLETEDKIWRVPYSKEYWSTFMSLDNDDDKQGIEVCCGRHGLYNFTDNIVGIDSINFHKKNFIKAVGEFLPIHKVEFVVCCNGIDHCCNPKKVLHEMFLVSNEVVLWVYVYPRVVSWIMQKIDKMHPFHFTMRNLENLLLNNTKIVKKTFCSPLFYLKYSNSRRVKLKLFIAFVCRVKGVCVHLEKLR